MKSPSDSPDSDSLRKLFKQASQLDTSNSLEVQKRIDAENRAKESEKDKLAYFTSKDDQLRLGDYYKMSASIWSYPNNFTIVQVFIPFMVYMIPSGFDFNDFLEETIGWNWHYLIVLYLLFFLLPVLWSLVKAFRIRSMYRHLSFKVTGLGMLVHRCRYLNYFRRCSITVQFNENSSLSKRELESIRTHFLKVLIGEIKKISNGKYIYQESGWTIKEDKVCGYANWESAGRIIRCIHEYLMPVQKEHQLVESVQIDFPSTEDKPDYFEWTPEGD